MVIVTCGKISLKMQTEVLGMQFAISYLKLDQGGYDLIITSAITS